MRIDAHQHFWVYKPENYPWIGEGMDVLRRDYLPADLEPLLASVGFDGSVVVQARQSVEETEWLLELADRHASILGVVGWVDLCSPKVEEQLERFAAHPKMKGVRHLVQDEPDDEFMLREDFQRGIGLLERYGLTYDILIFPRHLPFALKLVEAFPDQPFVVDHLAKPNIKEGRFSEWREPFARLARCENVYCKLSGMVTEAAWGRWKPEDFRPYLDAALESFGPERLMIGSDWPVCTLSGEYKPVMEIVLDYVKKLSETEQDQILGANCAAFYGIA